MPNDTESEGLAGDAAKEGEEVLFVAMVEGDLGIGEKDVRALESKRHAEEYRVSE